MNISVSTTTIDPSGSRLVAVRIGLQQIGCFLNICIFLRQSMRRIIYRNVGIFYKLLLSWLQFDSFRGCVVMACLDRFLLRPQNVQRRAFCQRKGALKMIFLIISTCL
ncbi:unnamed protein product [Adineta ricciae]|uniref:Uncharacterized protein n=1 Tax=Adineta ricciae TaxID=249248 RepID=A0A814IGT7_ADIRI|nr:unnamed protein product [Adineta ricciae]